MGCNRVQFCLVSSSCGLWLAATGLVKAPLEFPCRFAPLPWEPATRFQSASGGAGKCLGQWERPIQQHQGVLCKPWSLWVYGPRNHRCRKFALFYLRLSDPDIEKYLPALTPAVLLFAAGNWRENPSLIKDCLVLGSDGFVHSCPFSAAAGGWVPSLLKQRVQYTTKNPQLHEHRAALYF